MDAIERKGGINNDDGDNQQTEESETEARNDWENVALPGPVTVSSMGGAISKGLSRRIGQVRTGEWSLSGAIKRPSSLRNQEI
jgi:hypothetical protein